MDTTFDKSSTTLERGKNFLESLWFLFWIPVIFLILATTRSAWGDGDAVSVFTLIILTILGLNLSRIVFSIGEFSLVPCVVLIFSICLVSINSLFWVQKTEKGIWVNTETKQTTASQNFIFIYPFQSSVYFVKTAQPQSTKVKVTTSDRIPLMCEIKAGGIILDKENKNLLQTLTMYGSTNPAVRISDILEKDIRATTENVIGSKTSLEVSQLRQFFIPYHVGSPLGSTLSSLGLKWSEGEVFVNCRVLYT